MPQRFRFAAVHPGPAWLAAPSAAGEDEHGPDSGNGRQGKAHAALPFQVELWLADKSAMQRVLALATDATIAYGAFYAAARSYPDRVIILRRSGNVIARYGD